MFTEQQLDVIKNEAQMRARTWLTAFQNAYYARPANMRAMMESQALSTMEMPYGYASQRPPVSGRPEETENSGEFGDETPEE